MYDLNIVQVKEEDLEPLREFLMNEYEINKNKPEEATPDFFGLTEEAVNKIYDTLPDTINDPEVIFLVLKDSKGKIYGWGQITPYDEETAEMPSLYFTKDVRRQGWGLRMLNALIEKIKPWNMKKVFTLIQTDNEKAAKFLEAEGFVREETISLESEIYQKPLTVYKYVKKL